MTDIKINDLVIGGEPVGFSESTGTLQLAGDDFTLEDWQKLEKRINKLFERAGLLQPKKKRIDPNGGASSFLSANLKEILGREDGLIKAPPFWLKGKYSGVITKEKLWEQ